MALSAGRIYGATNFHLFRTTPAGDSVDVLTGVRWERGVGASTPWTDSSIIAGFGPHFLVYKDTLMVADQSGNLWTMDTTTLRMHRFRGFRRPWVHQTRVVWLGDLGGDLHLMVPWGTIGKTNCETSFCDDIEIKVSWVGHSMSTHPFVQGDSLTYDAPEGRLARVSLADGGLRVTEGPPEMATRPSACYFPLGNDLGVVNQKGVWRRTAGSWEKIPNAPSAQPLLEKKNDLPTVRCRTISKDASGTLIAGILGDSPRSYYFLRISERVQARGADIRVADKEVLAESGSDGYVYFYSWKSDEILRFDPTIAFGDGK